jgi:hypothetical protein
LLDFFRYANATLGTQCVVENTPYIGYSGTDEFIDIVSRGNCVNGLYCDSQQKVCVQAKALNAGCDADKEYVRVIRLTWTPADSSPLDAHLTTASAQEFVARRQRPPISLELGSTLS